MSKDRELMQQALEALNHVNVQDRVQIIAALRERLAQPEQEPVAYRSRLASGDYTYCKTAQFFDNAEPLYTSPPQRKPLTDEQIERLWYEFHDREFGWARRFARAIEAAHGITGEQA